MDEQDTSQLSPQKKVDSESFLPETEPRKSVENCSEAVVFAEPATDNEVITIVTDGEVYICDRNDIESAPEQNAAEYVQICESVRKNAFDLVNNSEEKEVNVDGIEEEENVEENNIEEIKEKKGEQKDVKEEGLECVKGDGLGYVKGDGLECVKEEDASEEENLSKNYKNVILEDWEVEVPQIIQDHGSENYEGTLVVVEERPLAVGTQEQVTGSNEDCTIVQEAGSEEPRFENKREKGDANIENVNLNRESSAEKENSVEDSSGKPIDTKSLEKESSVEHKRENLRENNCPQAQNENSLANQNENSFANQNENSFSNQNESCNIKDTATPRLGEKRLEALKYPKSVTKEEIVKILDDSSERVMRPIVGGKDLFFSIELTKRLNQKLSLTKNKASELGEKQNESDSCNNNNTVDDRQKIVEILEADEIKDWKSVPSKSDSGPKENGNDMEISKAIKSMEKGDSETKPTAKTPRKTPLKKLRTMDKELERTLALQQLREEFPSTRKRSRTSKKVNHVPFLASTVLEKAMTSPEVSTALKPGPPKRRPCYLPDNATYSKAKEAIEAEGVGVPNSDLEMSGKTLPNAIVKTYSAKRKSTDAESDMKTTLEAVAKALNESSEEVTESKPKKQKTGTKESKNKILVKKKRKLKPGSKCEKKMKSELEKLLGDEGAVRMLYDTQHREPSSVKPKKPKFRTTTGLKKDLVQKTKLVKKAVMRLSGVGADGVFLRGKRRANTSEAIGASGAETSAVTGEEEPLFASTPNIVLYKPKKKQRAEASRILYRHSSSESFESSEGYRRTSFDADGLKTESTSLVQTEEAAPMLVEAERTPAKGKAKAKRSEPLRRRERKSRGEGGEGKGVRSSLGTESLPAPGSARVDLSNVPVRKSCRPRMVSKKYSIWSSTSMDSLSVESLGLKKLKKASTELGKKLNCKELTILQYEHFVEVVLTPTTTALKNSLNCEVLQELHQVFSYLSKEDSCRVVVITSRGSTFCQGVDINRILTYNEGERKKGVSQLVRAIREFVTCLASFKKLVIAGVQGAAVGLGVTLLPYCDLILCSDTASFYTPYVKLGQAPEGAPLHTFPHINRHLVSELLFKSRKLTAADAFKYGLVSQVIAEERFEKDLITTSRSLASQPVQGMQSIKFLLRKSEQQESNVSQALLVEGELLEDHWTSNECLTNLIRFLESGELQLRQGPPA